jgi:hypothetical protein
LQSDWFQPRAFHRKHRAHVVWKRLLGGMRDNGEKSNGRALSNYASCVR